jgi:hypothetical protein
MRVACLAALIFVAQGQSLAEIPAICLPQPDPTNKLGGHSAKAIKEKVAKLFPYMELSDFLPAWANPVRARTACFHCGSAVGSWVMAGAGWQWPSPEAPFCGEMGGGLPGHGHRF